ncbi:hypothetical protein V8G54_025062 [Vigna mungo]|uniref:Expansin-like A2 n=1 Tax=Vigna mungo TaxID=3915 RepID=A0AAQ3N7W5_VIGMU
MAFLLLFLLSLLASSATACDRCLHLSKASYFTKASVLSSGACGYGSQALDLSGGNLAAGVASLFKDGAGCGGCFQIRCKNPSVCSKLGTTVVLTDLNHNNQTDFVLSSRAFSGMAQKDKGKEILKLGIVDIEYKSGFALSPLPTYRPTHHLYRTTMVDQPFNIVNPYLNHVPPVPCVYKNQNLAVRVEESSKKPDYLAVKFLYQGGQTEIVGVDVAQVGSANWSFMSRNHGAVWDTSRVPKGALQFRFVVTAGYDGKWIWAKKVLPVDWKTGVIYDSGVQITDIAQEGCFPCDDSTWS